MSEPAWGTSPRTAPTHDPRMRYRGKLRDLSRCHQVCGANSKFNIEGTTP